VTRVGWVVLGVILLAAAAFAAMLGGGDGPRVARAPVAVKPPPTENWQVDGMPRLAMPVAGFSRTAVTDSWGDPRSGGRGHRGNDIMAAAGTPVVAVTPGTVEKLFQSRLGGTTLYLRSPDRRWLFYYGHLMAYAPGIREGQQVKTGDLLGFVGDTGAGSGGNPHLHFSVTRVTPQQKWYEGEDVNPYPMLRQGR
jgi:murein DD-endopeptidase MepM/ murein hydrolase activator NlpD